MTTPHQHAQNYNVLLTEEDGTQHLAHSYQLLEWDLHHWQDWFCNAGVDYIYVDAFDQVWTGSCKHDLLGPLHDDSTQLLDSPLKCTRESCNVCVTDLSSYKILPDF